MSVPRDRLLHGRRLARQRSAEPSWEVAAGGQAKLASSVLPNQSTRAHARAEQRLVDESFPPQLRRQLASHVGQTYGNHQLQRVIAPGVGRGLPATATHRLLGGQPAASRHIQRQTEVEFEFEEGLYFGPDEADATEDVEYFLDGVRLFLEDYRDNHQDAVGVFSRQMFGETDETAEVELWSAVLKKGLDLGKDAIVKGIGARVPGVEELVGLVEAGFEEVDRANRASSEANLISFINQHVLNTATQIGEIQNLLAARGEGGEARRALLVGGMLIAADETGDPAAYGQRLRAIRETLVPAASEQIIRALTETYLTRAYEIRGGQGLFGGSETGTGMLYLEYEVNEEETEARLRVKKLVSPYAAQVKELWRISIGDPIDVGQLDVPRIVELKRDRFRHDTHFLVARDRRLDPDRGAYGYARLVPELPSLNLRSIQSERDPIFL